MELYEKDNYTSDYTSIISSYIREYDISKANINILKENNCITDETYNWLLSISKINREIYIGMMMKNNPKISEILSKGFLNARKNLFEYNHIDSYSVLSIKKDAVYVIDKTLQYTQFGLINFRLANIYTSFYKISGLEFYYNKEVLHVKGINDEILDNYHKDYMLDLLMYIFDMAENNTLDDVLNQLSGLIVSYINLEFDINYYRELNRESVYRLKYSNITYDTHTIGLYQMLNTDENKKALDITYNYNLLCELYRIYLTRYFYKK